MSGLGGSSAPGRPPRLGAVREAGLRRVLGPRRMPPGGRSCAELRRTTELRPAGLEAAGPAHGRPAHEDEQPRANKHDAEPRGNALPVLDHGGPAAHRRRGGVPETTAECLAELPKRGLADPVCLGRGETDATGRHLNCSTMAAPTDTPPSASRNGTGLADVRGAGADPTPGGRPGTP